MAVATGIIVYRDASIEVDSVEYANQVTKARLVPDTPIQTLRTLDPTGVVQDIDTPAWTFELSGGQKNDSGGLAKALRDATPGTELDIVLLPKSGLSQPQASFTVLAMPVEFGGEQGSFGTFEIELPVVGQPTFGTSPAS